MKSPKLPIGLLCFSVLVILVSCQKQELSTPSNLNSTEKLSGLVPDNPAAVAVVPVIMSEQFLDNQIDLTTGSAFGSNITARRDRTAPTVSLVNPANNATLTGTITLQASASDNVGVAGVDFSVDGRIIGTATVSPYSYSWNTSSVAAGTHTVTATARDAAGNKTAMTVQVGINAPVSTADISAPSITITSPTSGASFNAGSTVSIAVNASDNVGVSSVSVSVDGTALGTVNNAPYSFSWNSTNAAGGTHTITATARDAAGNTSTSTVMVTINTTILTPPSGTTSGVFNLATPPVGDQGGEGSCAVFACTYAARTIERYYGTNATSYSYSTNIASPEYVYDQTKVTDCGSGASVITILDFMKNTGVCTWQSMPYSDANGCSLIPTSTQNAEAANYRISSYSKIYTTDSVAIKNMLLAKHPVIIGINLDGTFSSAGPGFIWRVKTGTGAAHCLIICGYDDSKHAYKVMNSWGTYWGDSGFSYIDYDLLPQVASFYSFVINN